LRVLDIQDFDTGYHCRCTINKLTSNN